MVGQFRAWTAVVLCVGLLSGCSLQEAAQAPQGRPTPASHAATSDEASPAFTPTPVSSDLLAAMLEPEDLAGEWAPAPDEERGWGVLDGYLCEEGWPGLDDLFAQLPSWQAVSALELAKPANGELHATVIQAAASGAPAQMDRALKAVRGYLERCFEHNRVDSGEESTYLPLAVEGGDDQMGVLRIPQWPETSYTAFIVKGPTLARIEMSFPVAWHPGSPTVSRQEKTFQSVVDTAVAKLPRSYQGDGR